MVRRFKVKKKIIGAVSIFLIILTAVILIIRVVNTEDTNKVTFDSMGGTSISAEKVVVGETIKTKSEPGKVNYQFYEWCTDKDLKEPFDRSTVILEDTVLYAKYVSVIGVDFHILDPVLKSSYLLIPCSISNPTPVKVCGLKYLYLEIKDGSLMRGKDRFIEINFNNTISSGETAYFDVQMPLDKIDMDYWKNFTEFRDLDGARFETSFKFEY